MFPGETISTGAAKTCKDCKETPEFKVYASPGGAGYYIGTYCRCGPYSRESDYFKSRDAADAALASWKSGQAKTGIRSPDFNEAGVKDMRLIELDPVTLEPRE